MVEDLFLLPRQNIKFLASVKKRIKGSGQRVGQARDDLKLDLSSSHAPCDLISLFLA